jgi:hypothetical protein
METETLTNHENGNDANRLLAVRCINEIINWAQHMERPIETYMGDTIHVVELNDLLDHLNRKVEKLSSNDR